MVSIKITKIWLVKQEDFRTENYPTINFSWSMNGCVFGMSEMHQVNAILFAVDGPLLPKEDMLWFWDFGEKWIWEVTYVPFSQS